MVATRGWAWGAADSEAFEAQLLSFAAVATLSPEDRAAALLTTSTALRLRLARDGLAEQQLLLDELLEAHKAKLR